MGEINDKRGIAMPKYAGSRPDIALKIGEYLETLPFHGESRSPISAAVMLKGELIAAASAGINAATGREIDTDALFNIGSVSKMYCTAAVLKLVELGYVGLDDYVYRLLPAFYTRDERYKKIKVHMLLDHSSGLPGTNFRNAFTTNSDISGHLEGMYRYWHDVKLKADPGAFSVYCNEGFELASALIEKLSGMDYYRFLKKYFLDPIGADSTGTDSNRLDAGAFMCAAGQAPEYISVLGTGGIRTNISDCVRFANLFLDSGSVIDKAVLGQSKRK